jgi:hypothetical protein
MNASVMFQVDNGRVFKEETSIVPTIINVTLSYMPWGGDNAMPYNILKFIEDETSFFGKMWGTDQKKHGKMWRKPLFSGGTNVGNHPQNTHNMQ